MTTKDYIDITRSELIGYYLDMQAQDRLDERAALIEHEMTSLKGMRYDREPVTGSGANGYEDRICAMIAEKDIIATRKRQIGERARMVERALATLRDESRDILMTFVRASAEHGKYASEEMQEKYMYSRSQVYAIYREALADVARAMWGGIG